MSSIGRWISRRIWGRKEKEKLEPSLKDPNFSSELEYLNNVDGGSGSGGGRAGSNFGRVERKRPRREVRVDKENDMVIVSSDEGFSSSSDSEDSDWSVGWLEPDGPDFRKENETDNSFAVIVPCYGRGRRSANGGSRNNVLGGGDFVSEDRSDNMDFVEEWLSSLQKIDIEVNTNPDMAQPKMRKH